MGPAWGGMSGRSVIEAWSLALELLDRALITVPEIAQTRLHPNFHFVPRVGGV